MWFYRTNNNYKINLQESPFCKCPVGFKGHLCEQNIDDCLDDSNILKCQNRGQCIDGINEYTCNCTGTGKINKWINLVWMLKKYFCTIMYDLKINKYV